MHHQPVILDNSFTCRLRVGFAEIHSASFVCAMELGFGVWKPGYPVEKCCTLMTCIATTIGYRMRILISHKHSTYYLYTWRHTVPTWVILRHMNSMTRRNFVVHCFILCMGKHVFLKLLISRPENSISWRKPKYDPVSLQWKLLARFGWYATTLHMVLNMSVRLISV